MITTKDLIKRLQRIEELSKKYGRRFTAILTDGQSVSVDASEAIMLVQKNAAIEIKLDFMTTGCGQLVALLNSLLRR